MRLCVKTAVPSCRASDADRGLEKRIEELRHQLAGLVVTLSKASRQLNDLEDELRSYRQADKVVTLSGRRPAKGPVDRDILLDFLD
jgi:chromosome segregation ATPase